MLDVINLEFDYPEKLLLQGVQFSLNAGCLLHLRGANGAGKTTLLKLIAGLLQPSAGDICYRGKSITADLAHFKRNICYVGHKAGISQILTVRENCRYMLRTQSATISLDTLLKKFSLQAVADIPCAQLSLGQRRSVALLRLMVSEAALWLLDEPLIGLDKRAIATFMGIIADHLAQNGQVILTSHQKLPLQKGSYQEFHL